MQRGGGRDPQYEMVCSPTECLPITQHSLPAVSSPPNTPTVGAEEQAVNEPIAGEKHTVTNLFFTSNEWHHIGVCKQRHGRHLF